MNAHAETRSRPAVGIWARVALALLAAGGMVALATARPDLPWTPWEPIQPTVAELVRQTLVCLAWLALLAICLWAGWVAMKPPRRLESITYARPRWLPERRTPHPPPRRNDSRELLRLFVRPQTIAGAEAGLAPVGAASRAGEHQRVTAPSRDAGTRVSVRLIGSLRVGGTNGETPRERATRGLIAYLILKRAPATMDELAEALWPGENPTKTRQRLWKAKRQAHKLLSDALVRQHDTYAIDRARISTDIEELDELRTKEVLDAADVERLTTLTQEDALADLEYAWADGERRRLHAVQAELLARLAERRLAEGAGGAALTAAERLIQLDPLNERGWCLAMEAEGALGNRQAILDRYARLRGELDERLGLKPGAEAKETYRRLLGQT